MASSTVFSWGLGVYRGYLIGKSSLIRQISCGTNENRGRSSTRCYSSNGKMVFGNRLRRGVLPLSLLSLGPATAGHCDRALTEFDYSHICGASLSNPGAVVEDETKEQECFLEVGYIADTHGLQGELHVHSSTDFPEERFGQPGIRWLRMHSMGKTSFRQVELLRGRIGPGKRPSWLITLKDFNTLEKASELVGATVLVTEDERPSLDQDEFYIPDLVGMSVALQDSGQEIGSVLNVFSPGGDNDLLQVSLLSHVEKTAGRKIWIPFVKEIVPVVDKKLRRIEITPPQGLLGLNAPAESKDSKKQNLKERRKVREKLAGLTKKLTAMGQEHILTGLSSGIKKDQDALLDQLLSIDFGMLKQALQETVPCSNPMASRDEFHLPEPPSAFPRVNWEQFDTWMDSPSPSTDVGNSTDDNVNMARWWKEGLQLVADGRVAVVVLAGGQSTRLGDTAPPVKGIVDLGLPNGNSLFHQQAESLRLVQELASLVIDPEFNPLIPWIVMTSDSTDQVTRQYFEEKDFFGLDESQVWFIKQDSMPCVSLQSSEGHRKILMETPWKVAEAPNGNGGLFSALLGEGIVDRLFDEGIDYVQVYAVDNALVRVADPVFFGYTKVREADVGVKVVAKISPEEAVGVLCLEGGSSAECGKAEDSSSITVRPSSLRYGVLEYSEMPEALRYAYEEIGELEGDNCMLDTVTTSKRQLRFRAAHICVNIFSVDFLRRLGESEFEFKFHTASKRISHVKQQDKDWVEEIPEKPNGMKLELFIFDAFKFCDPMKVALLEVHREEEFAPVKNAPGAGVPDSVDTARDLVLALQSRFKLSTLKDPVSPERRCMRKLLVAYLSRYVDEEVRELLGSSKDGQVL